MKKAILSTAFILLANLGNSVYAQTQASEKGKQNKNLSIDERVKKETKNATNKLGLSDDQKKKWEVACRDRITANTPLKEKLEGSTTPAEREVLRGQIEANAKKFDSSVLTFLNADQKTKYEAFKKDKKGMKAEVPKMDMN